jgi:hypothetical protein
MKQINIIFTFLIAILLINIVQSENTIEILDCITKTGCRDKYLSCSDN